LRCLQIFAAFLGKFGKKWDDSGTEKRFEHVKRTRADKGSEGTVPLLSAGTVSLT
jgi:hypothetical protein